MLPDMSRLVKRQIAKVMGLEHGDLDYYGA